MLVKKIIILFLLYGIGAILFESIQEVEGHKKTPYNLRVLKTQGQNEKETDDLLQQGRMMVFSGFSERGNALMDSAFLVSNDPKYLESKANTNIYHGQYHEAMKSLNLAIDKYNYSEAIGYKAWINFIYLKEYEAAIKGFNEYEALSPGASFTFAMSTNLLIGMTYKQMGKYQEATDQLTKYIDSTNPDIVDVYAYLYRGLAWFGKGETEKALSDYKIFLEKHPKGPEGHYHKGRAFLKLDRQKEACQCLKKSERLVRKGYRRAYIWHAMPDELHLAQVEEAIAQHCRY